MARLGTMTHRTLDYLARVDSLTYEMSWEAIELATHLRQHSNGQSEGLRWLVEDLVHASQECDRIPDPPAMSPIPRRG